MTNDEIPKEADWRKTITTKKRSELYRLEKIRRWSFDRKIDFFIFICVHACVSRIERLTLT